MNALSGSEKADILRIGMLGAARITPRAIIEPAALHDDIELSAVAARDKARAEDFAQTHDIARVADDYAALVADPDIDLVYIALPPSAHKHWAIEAMRAGKHVLCEKPFCMNANEAEAMVAASRSYGRRLIEAFHYRYHPLFSMALAHVMSGQFGAVRHIQAVLCSPINARPGELRYDASLGGGVLMDMGCYTLHWCRNLTGHEPADVRAEAKLMDGVDVAAGAEFRCGDVECAMQVRMDEEADRYSQIIIEGERGRMLLENPLAPQRGNRYVIESVDGSEEGTVDAPTTMQCQLMAVKNALLNGIRLPTEGVDSINNMRAIDVVRQAAGLF